MSSPPVKAKTKGLDIQVLRCLDPSCATLLAYEVDSQNVLYVDLSYTARRDGELRFFPCPKCGGRNIVEEIRDAKGKARHQVTRFAAAPS